MADVITMDGIGKRYPGVLALAGITGSVPAGGVVGLFGHNGAGKSTLIKVVLGLVRPTAGRIEVLGATPWQARARQSRRRTGYLPESVAFYGNLTGREVLCYFARLKRVPAAAADRLLERVGLAQAGGRRCGTYSKGMRQRLGLAQALLGAPALVVLDEPTSGLDPQAQRDFYGVIDELRRGGSTVIVSSHVLAELEPHIDTAMILHAGRLVAAGTLEELRARSGLPDLVCVRLRPDARPEAFADQLRATGSAFTCHRDGRFELQVDRADKLRVLRDLAARPEVGDVTASEASLARLYGHLDMDAATTREAA